MAEGLVKGEGFAVDASIVAADANRQRGVPSTEIVDWKERALSTRAVREYLEALDADEVKQVLPKNISLTDPQASWTAAPGGPAFYAYSTNYLIDTEHGIIMDVQATPAHRTKEVESAKTMIDRVEQQFCLSSPTSRGRQVRCLEAAVRQRLLIVGTTSSRSAPTASIRSGTD